MNEQAKAWATFAREDLRVAELTYEAEIWNQACFHAQQCVEKILKAALTE
jgi:HEPN domain-containing protein